MAKRTRVYMRELAAELERSSHTIRGWERDGLLPKALLPKRDDKGWRYWTPSQVVKLKRWMISNGMAPGKGLSGFKPSVDKVQGMLKQLREPRNIPKQPCPTCGVLCKNVAAHIRMAHPKAA